MIRNFKNLTFQKRKTLAKGDSLTHYLLTIIRNVEPPRLQPAYGAIGSRSIRPQIHEVLPHFYNFNTDVENGADESPTTSNRKDAGEKKMAICLETPGCVYVI